MQGLWDLMKAVIARARTALLRPDAFWDAVATEPDTPRQILATYVAPLAAIAPICRLIGSLTFGDRFYGLVYRPTLLSAVLEAVLSYGLTLGAVWAMAWALNALSPSFGGLHNFSRAFKATAYAATPFWLAGVVGLFPAFGWIGASIGGLCALYLLHLGLTRLMRPAPEKSLSYFAAGLLIALILAIVTNALSAQARHAGGRPIYMAAAAPQWGS